MPRQLRKENDDDRPSVGARNEEPTIAAHSLRGTVRKELTMADDLKQTGAPDDERINVQQDHELSYWSQKLGVSRDRLREVVAKVGPMRKAVEQHIRG